jgi:hypothetical protein
MASIHPSAGHFILGATYMDMDGMVLGFFLLAAFLGAVTTGVAGFAMGLVVSGIWLHILTPIQTVSLMVSYSVLLQGYSLWKLRHALSWRKVAPFVISSAIGVPIGAMLLANVNPAQLRTGVGLLLLYSIYYLARPVIKPVQGGLPADIGIGFLNGVLGGLTGLVGIVVVIWSQLRGWPKDVQRTVFQPVIIATSAMTAVWLGASGAVTAYTVELFLLGLPMLLAGTWVGMKLYGRLDEAGFRKVVLTLLLLSGIFLVVPVSISR